MKKNIIIIILLILVLSMGGYLVYDKVIDKKEVTTDNEEKESIENDIDIKEEDKITNNEEKELLNYDVNNIKNIVIEVPVLNSGEPEMKSTTIDNKEEIKNILLNVDNATEVGKVPDGIGFLGNIIITINYESDPSTKIVILGNDNLAINFAVGVGETGYGEFEIENKNFSMELIDKYQ